MKIKGVVGKMSNIFALFLIIRFNFAASFRTCSFFGIQPNQVEPILHFMTNIANRQFIMKGRLTKCQIFLHF